MYAIKCDICKDVIGDERKKIMVGFGWDRFDLCAACGWEVVDFLQDKKLVKLEDVSC